MQGFRREEVFLGEVVGDAVIGYEGGIKVCGEGVEGEE